MYLLSPVNASSYGLHIFIEIVRADHLGVGRQGGFYSHMFTPALWSGRNLPIVFFLTRCIPTPCIYIFLDSHTCTIWKVYWGICSVLVGPLISICLWHFWMGFQSFLQNFIIIPAYGLSDPYNLLGCILYCIWVVYCLATLPAALQWVLYFPSVTCDYRVSKVLV